MQEITGAKPVRDALNRRVVCGEQQTHLTQNQAALDVLCSSRKRTVPFGETLLQDLGSPLVSRRPFRPQSIVSDAFAR